ncbi:Hypothetical predicted protein [Mytilus galloprovincialis]|uniref:Uncharacterized protein n=1 Tax=Mytilus galloprovincialis TaxID=29158 RepID=A0A8B6GXU2_MYTGA|nr:Hypothetical predicted protein [Mytilus galloprovincialis]
MFGCVYFSKDRSLVVVSKISKDLKLKENEFAPKFKVSMDFKKDGIYQGIIVKTHESKDFLNLYAKQGFKACIQGKPDNNVLDDLYTFEPAVNSDEMVVGKRQTKRSEKILESEKQDEEMSPKKKKKKNKENDISNETGTEKQAEVSQKKNKKKNKADDSLTETNSSKPEVTVAKLKADQKKSEINAEKENSEAVLKELAGTAMENQFFNSSSKNVNATMHKEGISESQNLHNIIVPVTSPES